MREAMSMKTDFHVRTANACAGRVSQKIMPGF